MFCPRCGRDNLNEQKFCASCGTNLEAVSQMLSGNETNFFTRIDTGLDQFTARYAEHVFKDAPTYAADRRVSNSWKLLGKGILTSFMDIFLALILWNFFSLRFHILLFSTPFRLLSERTRRQKKIEQGIDTGTPLTLPDAPAENWIKGGAPSVSEHTTDMLQEPRTPTRETSNQR